jgi:hypothetical protein
MHHNIQAKKATDTILTNWRSGTWHSPNISQSIHLTRVDASFPSPDGCFFEPENNARIAFEFKPGDRETQRGLLTGVGQCVAYLNRHGAAYLIAPNSVADNSSIGDYLEKVFRHSILGKLPIGLITYTGYDFANLNLRCDISERVRIELISDRGLDVNYWAAWRDTPPHSIYLLLKVANEITEGDDRSERIWNKYYFEYYVVEGSANTLEEVPSRIKMWDGITSQIPLKGIKNRLKNAVQEGQITQEQAISELKQAVDPSGVDNNYRDIKKNHYNFVNHLMLWNSEFHLTGYGRKLLEIGDQFGGDSSQFKDYLGSIMLNVGKHSALIDDVKLSLSAQSGTINNIEDVRESAYNYLEGRGHIKTNPNRTTSGVRSALASEFGVWGHFGILNQQNGSYFHPETGLSFNNERIEHLVGLTEDFIERSPGVARNFQFR